MCRFWQRSKTAWCDPFCEVEDARLARLIFHFRRDFDKSASLGVFFRFFRLISYFFVDNLFQLSYLAELQVFRKQISCEKMCEMVGWPSG